MKVDIWDVGHGGCAVVTMPNGRRLMVDCGHDGERPWWPSVAYRGQDIEELVVSNYDEDHVSDLVDVMAQTRLAFIQRNPSVLARDLAHLKSEYGMGPGIARLKTWMEQVERTTSSGRSPDWGDVQVSFYWNSYPAHFDDENNLSVVTFVEWSGFGIVFPGDLEAAGWERLLTNADFRRRLQNVNVFVASHHGRRSGCCEAVFSYCSPQIVVMSDRDKQFNSQETNGWYGARTRGIQFNGGTRKVFTTRSDGDIHIAVGATSWSISTQSRIANAGALGAYRL